MTGLAKKFAHVTGVGKKFDDVTTSTFDDVTTMVHPIFFDDVTANHSRDVGEFGRKPLLIEEEQENGKWTGSAKVVIPLWVRRGAFWEPQISVKRYPASIYVAYLVRCADSRDIKVLKVFLTNCRFPVYSVGFHA